MKTLVVIKVGSTFASLAARCGDFEDWILAGLQSNGYPTAVVDVAAGDALPPYDSLAGVVITGSHSMVTERQPWSERTAEWLPGLLQYNIPTLGICYGHQLLAHAFGGRVDNNPNGRQFGVVTARFAAGAEDDQLFRPFVPQANVFTCHTQAVLQLPEGARPLAATSKDPYHAFALGDCVWGIQFHPEFDAEVTATYIRECHAILRDEGQDTDVLLQTCSTPAVSDEVLRRFFHAVVMLRPC